MPKPNYTKEEKKILWKSSLGCKIILVLCFLPWLFLSFLSFLYCEDGYAFVIVFWILTVPYVILALFAFRVQIFWSEEKQRNYIATKIKQQPVAEPKTITLSASEADAMYDSLKEELKSANYRDSRRIYFQLSQLLLGQGKRSDALEMLLRVFYLEVSGVELAPEIEACRQGQVTKDVLANAFTQGVALNQQVIEGLKEFPDVYDSEMIDLLYTWKLPVQICDKEQFKVMVEEAVHNNFDFDSALEALTFSYLRYVENL